MRGRFPAGLGAPGMGAAGAGSSISVGAGPVQVSSGMPVEEPGTSPTDGG